jgi:glucosamine--fructose-6-phosphate aminotransferase (isomerizing)
VCGIVGYTGFRDAKDVVIDCLKHLEYRGYDSAGVAVLNNNINVYKKVGEISKIEKNIPNFKGNTAISHTRWATMGAVNEKNAHPHSSCDKKISIVHNGIIENYKKLRENLEEKGHKFTSNTDTEVIAHVIEEEYKKNKVFQKAFVNGIKKLHGSYAIVAISKDQKNKLFVARNESPIVIGIGDNENFAASDITALLKYTSRMIYLDDREFCTIEPKKVNIYNYKQEVIQKEEKLIKWNIKDAEKSGFPHFMLKEIYDQPDAINQVLRGRISEVDRTINFNEKVIELLKNNIDSIHIVACGTSYFAGLFGKYLIEKFVDIPVFVDLSSEYRYFGIKNKKSLVIGITQSGETADTLGALREAKSSGCRTLVLTNIIGSTVTRVSDAYILMQSGPEIGVAATKTFTSQILVLFLIALKLGMIKNKISADEIYKYIHDLREVPRKIRDVLDKNNEILDVARQLKNAKSVFFIGRGVNYPLSLEGALKLKEISYIHAEGFAAGELKHGPFALLTNFTPVVVIATKDISYDKILVNIGEIKARGPQVIAIAEDDDTEIEKYADFVLRVPGGSGILSSIPIIVVLQLLAYHVANLRECSIDKPRNLAKSVTVE